MTRTVRWGVATAIACVVILAAGWFLLAKPQKGKIADLKAQTASQESANAVLLTQIRALQAEQKDLVQQQLVEQKFSTEIPDDAAEPTLIRQLSATAKGAGIDLTTITPGAPSALSVAAAAAPATATATATGAGLYELPLSLSITGTYANIESFFAALEHLPRAIIVNSFSLAPSGDTAQSPISTTLSTAVFFAPGSAPIAIPTPASSAPAASTTNAPAAPSAASSAEASTPPLPASNG